MVVAFNRIFSENPISQKMECQLPVVKRKNLVSNVLGNAPFQDQNVVAPWGLVADGCGRTLVSANSGTGTVSFYTEGFTCRSFSFSVPGTPTGLVLNPGDSFPISDGTTALPAQVIVVSQNGAISGYHPCLNRDSAIVALNTGDVLTGVAIRKSTLYVANFSRGTLDLYSGTFNLLSRISDPGLSTLGYAPYNVANVHKEILVSFALRDGSNRAVPGAGQGYLDRLCDGELLRLVEGGVLNAPWGLTGTRKYILIGNFGDGKIQVFRRKCGTHRGSLHTRCGGEFQLSGLRAVEMGRKNKKLYISAGIDNGTNGLLAKLLFRRPKRKKGCNCG